MKPTKETLNKLQAIAETFCDCLVAYDQETRMFILDAGLAYTELGQTFRSAKYALEQMRKDIRDQLDQAAYEAELLGDFAEILS